MSLLNDLISITNIALDLVSNKVSRFCYTSDAYINNDVDSPPSYDYSQDNNIPSSSVSDTKLTMTQVDKGFRVTYPSIPKTFFDHFFGRVSYNLNKLIDLFSTSSTAIKNAIASANGLVTLDEHGRIPEEQAEGSLMFYRGSWNADTNTPYLHDGTGTRNDMYICNVSGVVNFGSGNIPFLRGDRVVYDGSAWGKLAGGYVSKVSDTLPDLAGNVNLSQQSDINKVLSSQIQHLLLWWEYRT